MIARRTKEAAGADGSEGHGRQRTHMHLSGIPSIIQQPSSDEPEFVEGTLTTLATLDCLSRSEVHYRQIVRNESLGQVEHAMPLNRLLV